jgi:hypothetical protein
MPANLAVTMKCPGTDRAVEGVAVNAAKSPAGIGFTEVLAPRSQPNMIDARSAPPARTSVPRVDLSAVVAPSSALLAERSSIRW